MTGTVIGITSETKGMSREQLDELKRFSGKNAGICYMDDDYFDSAVTDPDKADKRFRGTIKSGHHSISDHAKVEVLFEGISKMLAMTLNSLQDYATSEKSGRYSKMTGDTDRERELYNKWSGIFEKRALEIEPYINDAELTRKLVKKLGAKGAGVRVCDGQLQVKDIENRSESELAMIKELLNTAKKSGTLTSKKIAQENARMVLSIFSHSTTMGYSTSLRQWNYIYDWCEKIIGFYNRLQKANCEVGNFFDMLVADIKWLRDFIGETLYVENLRDTKDRCIDFLGLYSGYKNGNAMHPARYFTDKDEILDYNYNTAYDCSLVILGQLERHRTIKYQIISDVEDDLNNNRFYIPKMIRGTEYEKEWLSDLESVKDVVPQATKVRVLETGLLPHFAAKAQERLCGRAQLEAMECTKELAEKFIDKCEHGEMSEMGKQYVYEFMGYNAQCLTKCEMQGKCLEGCRYGAEDALHRSL